jgi:UDP-N-acetyl-2-amino-2-deoxyglucuronate dehydrogenase
VNGAEDVLAEDDLLLGTRPIGDREGHPADVQPIGVLHCDWRARERRLKDTAEVRGRLISGAHVSCGFTSVSEIPHSERLELYGTDGGIIVDQLADPVVKMFRGHRDFNGEPVNGVPFGPDGWNPGGWHYESVIAEVTDYVQSLLEGRPPMINSYDCAYAIGVVEASYKSIRSKEPVSLGASAIAG